MSDQGYETPFHEFIAAAREKGLAVDISLYARGEYGTWDDYQGSARVTGHKGDPMDVIRRGIESLRARE